MAFAAEGQYSKNHTEWLSRILIDKQNPSHSASQWVGDITKIVSTTWIRSTCYILAKKKGGLNLAVGNSELMMMKQEPT